MQAIYHGSTQSYSEPFRLSRVIEYIDKIEPESLKEINKEFSSPKKKKLKK